MTARSKRPAYVAARKCRGPCKRVLPLSAFDLDASANDGRQAYCPECKADATRVARWLKQYGLTESRAQACLMLQNDVCPICAAHLDFRVRQGRARGWTVCVDHDHETGEVRGLVHNLCNLSPPQNAKASALWLEYCLNPPMREVHGGVPLIAPMSGLGEQQIELPMDLRNGS